MLVPRDASIIESVSVVVICAVCRVRTRAVLYASCTVTHLLEMRLEEGSIRIQVNLRSSMKFLDIGEVSERTGIRPSTLRYYEEIGLISSITRHGLRRQFSPEVELQLRLIAMGKSAGFSLAEISGMFGKEGTPELPRAVLHQKAEDLDAQIRRDEIIARYSAPRRGVPGTVAHAVSKIQAVDGSGRQANRAAHQVAQEAFKTR